ncbi:MAG: uracil-DNA glycosylase family protein [Pseudomonadota bacterium]
MRVHKSGKPFDDASGDRLRSWMGIDRETFYDRSKLAVLPMAFCFPGYDSRGSDLPPPKICAETWHARAMAEMQQVKLKLLIGGASQHWHLGRMAVTERVRRWRESVPDAIPLPHPSWRNTAWLRKNPWFEEDVVPWLKTRIAELLYP